MQPNQSKNSILNPKIANVGTQLPLLFLPNDDAPMAKKLYSCSSSYYDQLHSYVADDLTVGYPSCHKLLNRRLSYVAGSGAEKLTAEDGGFVKGVVTYMIMDIWR
ncbi:hypothetical protein Ccrd_022406 [Cynara cardunculus var. scolymus]|uniref:Uncharacterized protein n=1 Tax=Cynara cardunculus var. scolymus TaxID=59895 RepID=A0A103XYQ2_CYNCS|nr:hypothetical protein Ccrd_022406 [Cynara cardunculus var. scolymus]